MDYSSVRAHIAIILTDNGATFDGNGRAMPCERQQHLVDVYNNMERRVEGGVGESGGSMERPRLQHMAVQSWTNGRPPIDDCPNCNGSRVQFDGPCDHLPKLTDEEIAIAYWDARNNGYSEADVDAYVRSRNGTSAVPESGGGQLRVAGGSDAINGTGPLPVEYDGDGRDAESSGSGGDSTARYQQYREHTRDLEHMLRRISYDDILYDDTPESGKEFFFHVMEFHPTCYTQLIFPTRPGGIHEIGPIIAEYLPHRPGVGYHYIMHTSSYEAMRNLIKYRIRRIGCLNCRDTSKRSCEACGVCVSVKRITTQSWLLNVKRYLARKALLADATYGWRSNTAGELVFKQKQKEN